jgi:peptidyl-prolyl cis-trans isomerase B (cyclophilin B)
MKQLIFLLLMTSMFSSCSKLFSDFAVQQNDKVVPAEAVFAVDVEDADEVIWNIDGNTYKDKTAAHRFLKSGKHEVTLTVQKGKKTTTKTKDIFFTAPEECLVELSTPQGSMLIELYEETPIHRDNFVKLAEDSYYNGTLFHRVIDGFMIQGGDPNSKEADQNTPLGGGGPGYQLKAEFDERFAHVKGSLAAARTGDQINPEKKSSGSQFYIVHGKAVTEKQLDRTEISNGITYSDSVKEAYLKNGGTPFLDGEYTVFGRVIDGLEVIDKIAEVQTGRGDRPREDVKMNIVVIK